MGNSSSFGWRLRAFAFWSFVLRNTVTFFTSCSWQQLVCSFELMWAGKEWNGIGPPAWRERVALGMWVFKSSGMLGSEYDGYLCCHYCSCSACIPFRVPLYRDNCRALSYISSCCQIKWMLKCYVLQNIQ